MFGAKQNTSSHAQYKYVSKGHTRGVKGHRIQKAVFKNQFKAVGINRKVLTNQCYQFIRQKKEILEHFCLL